MSKGRIKKVFPGGNTSKGFFSFYNYILSQEEATRIIVLKGGPGVGKSSFMKKVANEMAERGYDVEYMHCSSDNGSLDGVVIPAVKVALIDGTAPHIVDPKNPGAVDEIIHLGDYWDEDGIRANRESVVKANAEIGTLFSRAYRYLKAAAAVYEDSSVINGWAMNNAKANAIINKVIGDIFGGKKTATKEGRERCLFASAITPDGLINYLPTVLTTQNVYTLKGNPGTGTGRFLERVKEASRERGYDVEAYYCALNPDRLEHLVIPKLDIAFTTVNSYHNAGIKPYLEIDFNEYLDPYILGAYKEELEYNLSTFEALLNRAVSTIKKAKGLHDYMESFYIPNMDFEAVQRCWESTMARILTYADERR